MIDLGQLFGFAYFPCTYIAVENGYRVITGPGAEHCYLFDPPGADARNRLPGTESSQFLTDATSAPKQWTPWDEDQDTIWLQVDWSRIELQLPPRSPARPGCLLRLSDRLHRAPFELSRRTWPWRAGRPPRSSSTA